MQAVNLTAAAEATSFGAAADATDRPLVSPWVLRDRARRWGQNNHSLKLFCPHCFAVRSRMGQRSCNGTNRTDRTYRSHVSYLSNQSRAPSRRSLDQPNARNGFSPARRWRTPLSRRGHESDCRAVGFPRSRLGNSDRREVGNKLRCMPMGKRFLSSWHRKVDANSVETRQMGSCRVPKPGRGGHLVSTRQQRRHLFA